MNIPVTWNFDHSRIVSAMQEDGTIRFPADSAVTEDYLPNGIGYEIIESEEVDGVTVLCEIRIREFALMPQKSTPE